MPAAPLIVTLDLDEQTSAFFEERRRRYFPPERYVVGAHVTLFHALPGERADDVGGTLAAAARRPAFPVAVTGIRSLGRGAAYDLASVEAVRLRDGIAKEFAAELTRQDSQRLKPHVTVANKLGPERAREVVEELSLKFSPFEAHAVGLSLFRYRGGPWEPVATYSFDEL